MQAKILRESEIEKYRKRVGGERRERKKERERESE